MKISHDSETPAHGQQVISVTGFIHKKEDDVVKVFLCKRAKKKKFLPNVWEMPGGHVDYGEDIVEALRREVLEELGKSIKVGDPFSCFTYINKIKGSHSIEVVYYATFIDKKDIKLNPEDHSKSNWFSRGEVIRKIIPDREDSRREVSIVSATNEDIEMRSVLKGFSVLEGTPLDIAS